MGAETCRLLERQGATVISAPALKEVPLVDQTSAFRFGEQLLGNQVDVIVLLTGVGTRLLVDVLCNRWEKEQVLAALAKALLVCRGPKPVAALKVLGLKPNVTVPEPNTWRDIIAVFEAQGLGKGKRIWVQEYGRPNPELVQALANQAMQVNTVTLYGWTMPDDLEPLKAAIAGMISNTVRIALFTTGVQVDHLFELAGRLSLGDAVKQAMIERIVIASIGPLTTQRLEHYGIHADIEPEHPKLGHLVAAVAEQARDVFARKRH
jgi:uroporphyrinogen-III synthase